MNPKDKVVEIARICDKITKYRDGQNKIITEMHSTAHRLNRELKKSVNVMIDFECEKKKINPTFIKNIL